MSSPPVAHLPSRRIEVTGDEALLFCSEGRGEGRRGTGMNILLVLAHPAAGSFNHSIAQEAARMLQSSGYEVVFHDLYAEGFDPILPADEIPEGAALHGCVGQHCAEISRADGIVIVHPNWWGQPPAIMKGWIDRVIRPGVEEMMSPRLASTGMLAKRLLAIGGTMVPKAAQ